MTHTKGPWDIIGGIGADRVFITNGSQEDSDGRTIATVIYNEDQSQEANANLIAAAPDLLEALIELDNAMQDECGYVGREGSFEVVQAAISKARGQS